ncbi:type VII secretion protein EccB [Cellulomonas chengniuliangii]|uniref:type VII secretion protein EccB n=1 Tax=Cellulomonas chengniuliangii TaxID=2968084 RepID=UPI001D0EDE39|nr:type VII secretion protein EccB [Cellulomonas chengniuliangii]MCC2318877.1 type VII secretion protein EccB [Cellulomonas chengniuliangii]
MASKRDLVEAQTYSRRRLLTAFVSGAPGGQELEPTKPLRGVAAGVALSVLLVAGSWAFGLLAPSLPSGWDDSSLVLVKADGSRYVAVDGTLYPVLNTTSARLVIPSQAFKVVTVKDSDIVDTPRGPTIGIAGAPDSLPAASRLVPTGWLSCAAGDGSATTLLGADLPLTADAAGDPPRASLVTVAGDLYVVAGGYRYLVPDQHVAAVRRALELESGTPLEAPAGWLGLFAPGADLAPLEIPGAGDPAPLGVVLPGGAVVGSVVVVAGAAEGGTRYVVDAQGELAALSPLAYPLYQLGSGASTGPEITVSAAQVANVRTAARPVAPADWPLELPTAVGADETPCARLATGDGAGVDLVTTPMPTPPAATDPVTGLGVRVVAGGGALVRAQGAAGATSQVLLVDQSGVAFPVPDANDEILARLGYTPDAVVTVPPAWAGLFAVGPALTEAAAATEVVAAHGS